MNSDEGDPETPETGAVAAPVRALPDPTVVRADTSGSLSKDKK